MAERTTQNEIRNALAGECLAWRVNVGRAWTGSRVEQLPGGRVLIHDARPFSTGLPPGFSDLLCLVPRTITADMVGQRLGQFGVIECKSATGRVRDAQGRFLRAIAESGGLSGVARSPADALAIIRGENE